MSVEAALLCAVDPVGLGGVALRCAAGPQRDAWLAGFRALMGHAPWRRIPPDLPDNRLLGGLDLTATLALGRPVAETGVLAAVDGGTLVIAMAERMPGGTAARRCEHLAIVWRPFRRADPARDRQGARRLRATATPLPRCH